MRTRMVPLLVLVAAAAALVASAAWAIAQTGDGWTMHRDGNGMMGYAQAGGGGPVGSIAEARRQAGRFADRIDLEVGEVMRFSNHYYAELEEDGRPATEVLVDPRSGAVYLEYGPAMMWNTRFGMMSGSRFASAGMMGGAMMGGAMMGGPGFADATGAPGAEGDVSSAEARAIAERWLAENGKKLEAGEAKAFPGYYTMHVLRSGEIAGMISVDAATGAPWYHWWHGELISTDG